MPPAAMAGKRESRHKKARLEFEAGFAEGHWELETAAPGTIKSKDATSTNEHVTKQHHRNRALRHFRCNCDLSEYPHRASGRAHISTIFYRT
jgi:hypothetical protein